MYEDELDDDVNEDDEDDENADEEEDQEDTDDELDYDEDDAATGDAGQPGQHDDELDVYDFTSEGQGYDMVGIDGEAAVNRSNSRSGRRALTDYADGTLSTDNHVDRKKSGRHGRGMRRGGRAAVTSYPSRTGGKMTMELSRACAFGQH